MQCRWPYFGSQIKFWQLEGIGSWHIQLIPHTHQHGLQNQYCPLYNYLPHVKRSPSDNTKQSHAASCSWKQPHGWDICIQYWNYCLQDLIDTNTHHNCIKLTQCMLQASQSMFRKMIQEMWETYCVVVSFHLVWLLLRDSILACTCFHVENFCTSKIPLDNWLASSQNYHPRHLIHYLAVIDLQLQMHDTAKQCVQCL